MLKPVLAIRVCSLMLMIDAFQALDRGSSNFTAFVAQLVRALVL